MIDLTPYTGIDFAPHRSFWGGICNRLALPWRWTDPQHDASEPGADAAADFESIIHLLSSDSARALAQIAGEDPLRQDVVLMSAMFLLLSKYTHSTTIAIVTPGLHPDGASFVLLQADVPTTGTLGEWIGAARDLICDSYQYQDYPLVLVDPTLNGAAAVSNVMFRDEGIHTTGSSGAPAMDLTLEPVRDGHSLRLKCTFRKGAFTRATILKFCQHFDALMNCYRDPARKLSECPMVLPAEESAALLRGAAPSDRSPSTLIGLFERQVMLTPDATAVRYEEETLSYEELERLSSNLAAYLHNMSGWHENCLVGILLEKSPRAIVAMLAVMKAGGAYVPLDPSYPPERLEMIFRDSQITVLLIDSAAMFSIEAFDGEVFVMDLQLATLPDNTDLSTGLAQPDSLAYVIYTSGSTGTPKGVMIEQGAISNTIKWRSRYYGMAPGHVVLQFASISFDSSVEDIFTPLSCGAALLLPGPGTRADLPALVRLIESGVTHILLVPSLYQVLLEEAGHKLSKLLAVTVAGEACPRMLVERHCSVLPHVLLVNEYGPTENSVCSTAIRLESGGSFVSIGIPIDNGHVRMLDPQLALLPHGIIGQIGLGGPGLARGYRQSESRTSEKFVRLHADGKTERVYLSGDLGCIRTDGTLEFHGRMDEQLKINGYRIEPGEVEHALCAISGVCEAIVRARTMANGKAALVAWYTKSAGPAETDAGVIKTHLRSRLPSFMVPDHFSLLASFPRTPNGKIDIAGLPVPDGDHVGERFVAPRNSTESLLSTVWADVFEVDRVGVEDDFFSLHGDSITALRLLSRIQSVFGTQMQIDDIYRFPTIASQASRLAAAKVEDSNSAAQQREALSGARQTIADFKQLVLLQLDGVEETSSWQEVFPLTAIEKGILFQSLLGRELAMHHDQFCFDFIDSHFEMDRFRHAISMLYGVHDILRASYRIHSLDEPALIVHFPDSVEPDLSFMDLRDLDEAGQRTAISGLMSTDRSRPFELDRPGLLRFYLLRRDESKYTLLNVSHHLILDGWSHNVLLDSLFHTYDESKRNARPSTPQPATDFAEDRAHGLALSAFSESRLAFWRTQLEGFVRTPLPLQRSYRPGEPGIRVGEFSITADAELAQGVDALAEGLQISAKHVYLGAFAILMAALSQMDDIIFGLVTNTRPIVPGADRLIGNYLNTVPFRINTDPSCSVADFLTTVRDRLTGMRSFEFLPLADIARGTEDGSRNNPFFDVLFNYIDFRSALRPIAGFEIRETGVQAYEATSYPVDFTLSAGSGEFRLIIRYYEPTYEESGIARIASTYLRILRSIQQDPLRAIDSIDWIDPLEAKSALEHLTGPEVLLPAECEGGTIDAVFQLQARRTPDAVALVTPEKQFSYARLDDLSTRLASHLVQDCRIQAGDIIGISLPRDEWQVITILAIHKAGAAYLPLDPTYPTPRLQAMLSDSGAVLLLCTRSTLPDRELLEIPRVYLEDINVTSVTPARSSLPAPDHSRLAYLIYTSGSTGTPKGVRVSHHNVINFFAGMDQAIEPHAADALLAVTNLTFDISVLELLWTICRGIQVVMHPGEDRAGNFNRFLDASQHIHVEFSLFFFSSYERTRPGAASENPYQLLLDCCRYADEHQFKAVWTPERHFHEFGALFPNPAITSAAIAAVTKNIQIRAGSVVAALHHPIRLAEEWAAVDQMSGGRVALSFASGWHPDDFVLNPEAFASKEVRVMEQLESVRRLWRGESITLKNGVGREVAVRAWPRPKQDEIPIWITAAGDPQTFYRAGEAGAHLLTHLLGKDLTSLGENIAIYRKALSENGFDLKQRTVTVMVHTYMGSDETVVKKTVEAPLKAYLKSSIDLAKLAGNDGAPGFQDLSPQQQELMLHRAFERYYSEGALIGTPQKCAAFVSRLHRLGVDEIASLVDFGLPYSAVMESLAHLAQFKKQYAASEKNPPERVAPSHKPITMLQATPSLLNLLCRDETSSLFLRSLKKIMAGGEPLPVQLLRDLGQFRAELYNMYGPTETTVWSTVHAFPPGATEVSIGKPIANTKIALADRKGRPLPVEVIGEIVIGGAGVSQGYHRRPELTAERFVDGPAGIGRAYRTGDLAYLLRDGSIRFLGRNDHQIKFNGHRLELGDIESHLLEIDGISQAVVLLREVANQPQLVAYLVHRSDLEVAEIRQRLSERLPLGIIPSIMISLPEIPWLASGKVDRSSLAAVTVHSSPSASIGSKRPDFTKGEERIAAAWAKVLKHSKFDASDNFFAVGGNSILLVSLHTVLRAEFKEPFTLMDLLIRPSVREFASFLDRKRRAEPESPAVLIPMNEIKSGRDAVLLLPSSLGDPSEFQNLLPWLPDVNCYGLDLINLKHDLFGPVTLEALAERARFIIGRDLISSLRAIVGYSFGVKMAIALAARLNGRGVSPRLVLLDGNIHRRIQFEPRDVREETLRRDDGSARQYEIETLRQAEAVFDFNDSLSGDICCVEALNTPGIRTNMQTIGQLTNGEFEYHQLVTAHSEILARPAANLLGPLVRDFLGRRSHKPQALGMSS